MENNILTINGVDYIPVSSIPQEPKRTGDRCVVVVDRGWIFAGDLSEKDGRIRLDDPVMVLRWESIGFDGMIADPSNSKVKLKKMPAPVDLPIGAEVFRVPVCDKWGM